MVNFGTPRNYGDWTTYAGLDSTKPMMGVVPPMQQTGGVAPPTAPTFGQMADRFSQVANQIGQGNFGNAAKTFMSGGAPAVKPAAGVIVPGVPAATQPKDLDGDGMISEWEEDKHG